MRDKILWVGMTVLLILTPWTLRAQEPNPDSPVNTAPTSKEDWPSGRDTLSMEDVMSLEDAPSLEFLEFLGDWETEDGQWTDPAEFEVPLSEQEMYDEESEPKKN